MALHNFLTNVFKICQLQLRLSWGSILLEVILQNCLVQIMDEVNLNFSIMNFCEKKMVAEKKHVLLFLYTHYNYLEQLY